MDPDGATLPRFARGHSAGRSHRAACGALTTATVGLALAAVASRSIRRLEVRGESMAPTLLDGDRLLVLSRPLGPRRLPAVGQVVAVADPRDSGRILVKRVAAVDPASRTVEVLGDSPEDSTDSRHFGPVPVASVVGRVVHRYGPPGRAGPVGRPTGYHRA